MPTISEVAEHFVRHLVAQGLAESTVNTARTTTVHLQRAAGDKEISELTPADVDTMFNDHSDWAQGTRNNYILHLRGFLKYCRRHGYLPRDYDPTEDWKTKKLLKRNKTWLPLDVLEAVIVGAQPRDRAFMAVGAFTFLRASEICALKIKHLDFQNNEIAVWRIKTKQEDILPLVAELRDELVLWLTHYRAIAGPLQPEWFLIPAKGPQPMKGVAGKRTFTPDPEGHARLKPTVQIQNPHHIMQRNMRRVGLEVNTGDGCHILRRSGARNLFEALRAMGHDSAARRVQSFLGHSSVVITENYLGIDYEKRQRNQQFAGKPMFTLDHGQTAIEAPPTIVIVPALEPPQPPQ